MSNTKQSWLYRHTPRNVSNPFRLLFRLIRSGNPAARSAIMMAIAGAMLTPIDLALSRAERRMYSTNSGEERSKIFVVGPPRSGTTLLAQYLINSLEVCYINNLTSLFPRSPIMINRILRRWFPIQSGGYDAFYGKSRGLAGANDALYVWDRWLGDKRVEVPYDLSTGALQSIKEFFDALISLYELPVINKVNRLNTCAHLVSSALPEARFICLHREPVFLAQSLYTARREITGNMDIAYGIRQEEPIFGDPIEDVCQQVVFHEEKAKHQLKILGPDKFSILSYEKFCREPALVIDSLCSQHPDLRLRRGSIYKSTRFEVSDRKKLSTAIFDRMQSRLDELGAGQITFWDY